MHFPDCARKGRLLMRITAHGLPLLSLVMRLAYSTTPLLLAWKRGRNLNNMPFNFIPFFRFYTVSGLLVIGVLLSFILGLYPSGHNCLPGS